MDRDQKHRCKFCCKTFPCGRSLGGHMRCHVSSAAAAAAAADVEASRGYGLRENPKKTWRLSAEFGDLNEKSCRDCGKEFQSWKALFGHMRCHSEKIARAEQGDEGSWSDGGSHIGGGITARVPRKKRRSRRAVEYSKEQEDVAISLMMLSRDVGYWGNESSDKNSAVSGDLGINDEFLEHNSDDSDSMKKKNKIGSDVIDSEFRKYSFDASDSKLGKFECVTCNKSFNTYQALGGHRASHKRMRGCYGSENTITESDAQIDQVVSNHQCLICGKVFSSGQALGGHKRSHLAMASPTVVIQQEEEEEEDLIDLNLPARIDEDSSKGSVSVAEQNAWWAGSNLQHEAMLGMITN